MSRKRQKTRDEVLRELLRRGDPASDGCEPTPEETARLRRQVLDAARTRSDLPLLAWWRPAAAVTAVIVAALAAWLVLRAVDTPAPVLHQARDMTGGAPNQPQVGEAPPATPIGPSEPQPTDEPAITEAPDTRQVRIAAVSVDSRGTQPPLAPTENRSARTIRFTTRNGTRIIWTLDPNFEI